jgi:hypothetical protein
MERVRACTAAQAYDGKAGTGSDAEEQTVPKRQLRSCGPDHSGDGERTSLTVELCGGGAGHWCG